MHKKLLVYILSITVISCTVLLSGCREKNSAESTLAAEISTATDTTTKKAQADNSVSIADSAAVSATVSSGTGTSPEKKQDEKVKKADTPNEVAKKTNPPSNPKTAPTTSASISEVVPDKVDEKVNSIAARNVSDEDLISVINIVNGKLSMDELDYLFKSAKSDYWINTSVEDIEKAREILFSKLSDSDIKALTTIGIKYGKGMDILKKDLDIAKTKEAKTKNQN